VIPNRVYKLLIFIAFDEVECKPNFDLWLFRVGLPVHGYRLKNPHSCKDTKMATPLDFCRVMSWPVNWYRLMLRHVIRCGEHVSMWAGHVSSSFQWIFLWLLSIQSPYASLLCALSIRFSRIFNASTAAFIEIWGNFPCLLAQLGFGMITVGTATFWLHLLISSSSDR